MLKSRYRMGTMPKVFFVQESREVEVEPGRTIKDIALELGIDPNRKYQRLVSCEGHGLFDGCKCWVKDKGASTHVVKKGESVSLIAAEYGTDPYVLAELNGMSLHDLSLKVGQTIKIPALNGPTFSESMLHDLKGWQRLACQARVLRGEIEVWTLPQGDERLREPRPIAHVPPNPPKRERFLESRFKSPAPAEGEEDDKPKKAAKPAGKAAAGAKAAAKPADAKPAEEPKAAEAPKPAEAANAAATDKPAEAKPAAETKPAEKSEAKSEEKQPEAQSVEAKPASEEKPAEAKPVEPTKANVSPIVSPIPDSPGVKAESESEK